MGWAADLRDHIALLEMENAKLGEDYRCSCIESDTLLLDVKAWKSKYERLRDCCLAYLDGESTMDVAKPAIGCLIDAIEAEGK